MSKSDRTSSNQSPLDYDFESSFNLTSIINSQQTTPRSLSQTLIDFFHQTIAPSEETSVSLGEPT